MTDKKDVGRIKGLVEKLSWLLNHISENDLNDFLEQFHE